MQVGLLRSTPGPIYSTSSPRPTLLSSVGVLCLVRQLHYAKDTVDSGWQIQEFLWKKPLNTSTSELTP